MLKEKYEFPDTLFVNVNGNKQIVLFFFISWHGFYVRKLQNPTISPKNKNIDSYKV